MRPALMASLLFLTACSSGRLVKARAEALLVLDRGGKGTKAEMERAANSIPPAALSTERLKTYDVRTLEVLFQALDAAEEALGRDDLLTAMTAVFYELLEGRQGTIFDFHERLFSKYVGRRDWPAARALHAKLDMDELALPEIVESPVSGPAVYSVSEDGRRLTLQAVDLAQGLRIVSVVNPGCHFSQDAVKAISSDAELYRVFAEMSVNVYPAPFSLDAPELARANATGPIRYAILHKAERWPGVDFKGTPKFYFFKDGRLLDSVEGWRPPRSMERLREALAKMRG